MPTTPETAQDEKNLEIGTYPRGRAGRGQAQAGRAASCWRAARIPRSRRGARRSGAWSKPKQPSKRSRPSSARSAGATAPRPGPPAQPPTASSCCHCRRERAASCPSPISNPPTCSPPSARSRARAAGKRPAPCSWRVAQSAIRSRLLASRLTRPAICAVRRPRPPSRIMARSSTRLAWANCCAPSTVTWTSQSPSWPCSWRRSVRPSR